MVEIPDGETLGNWSRRVGITYRTAWRWFRNGKLPSGVWADKAPSGTILIQDTRRKKPNKGDSEAVIYVRINPRQPRSALQAQIDSCRRFCEARGWIVAKIVRELAPGVGSRRIKLARLIDERTPRLVVATTSVLSRFDFGFYEALWKNIGSELVVVDRSDEVGGKGGALEDLTDAINLTCHRHYGPKRGIALAEMLSKVVHGSVNV
jgi:putative resolvase